MGRLVERSWRGVRGVLGGEEEGRRERCVLRMRAVVLCSLFRG